MSWDIHTDPASGAPKNTNEETGEPAWEPESAPQRVRECTDALHELGLDENDVLGLDDATLLEVTQHCYDHCFVSKLKLVPPRED